jgi:hypothetical protein
MKNSKISKKQENKKPIHFHFPIGDRHLNLRKLLEDYFTDLPTGNSEERASFKR